MRFDFSNGSLNLIREECLGNPLFTYVTSYNSKLIMKLTLNFIFAYLLMFVSINVGAQDLIEDKKVLKVLIFKNNARNKTKMISQGAFIKYKLRSNPKKMMKGILEDVKQGLMIVDGKKIAFSDCKIVSGRVSSEAQLIGGIGLGMGAAGVIFSSAILTSFSIPVVGVVIGGCAALVGVGIYLIVKQKRFNLDKKWEIHSGELEYDLVN